MKDLDPATFLAVFQEMLGPLLWVLVALALAGTVAFLVVLLRDRGLRPRRLIWAEAAGLLGGIGAVLLMQTVTHSGFGDIGGPADWVLVALIFGLGAVGAIVLVYAALGLARRLA
jgi:hypothetical protein